MSVNRRAQAYYPDVIWDGTTPSRPDGLSAHQVPDADDWDQAVKEIVALEEHVVRPEFVTVEAINTINHVRGKGDASYSDIPDMQLDLVITSTQDVLVIFEAVSEAKNNLFRILEYQFSLDGTIFTPNDLVQYNESGAPADKERRKHMITYVFRDIPAGSHTIRARVSNASSGQSWDILYRRLTATY